jgi:hypothetical protein
MGGSDTPEPRGIRRALRAVAPRRVSSCVGATQTRRGRLRGACQWLVC